MTKPKEDVYEETAARLELPDGEKLALGPVMLVNADLSRAVREIASKYRGLLKRLELPGYFVQIQDPKTKRWSGYPLQSLYRRGKSGKSD